MRSEPRRKTTKHIEEAGFDGRTRLGSGDAQRRQAIERPQKPARNTSGDLKVRQILDGARQIFLADGFDGASMNEIASAAGVSKGTLYVYFPSKVSLFEALIRHDRSLQAEQLFQFGEKDDEDLRKVLNRIGVGLMNQLCTPDHLAHLRMVIGAVAKYPQIGKAFYEAGPQAGARRLGRYLKRQETAGRLPPLDADLAADQFIQLCQAGYYKAALFCVADPGDSIAVREAVDAAVETFLLAYRLDPAR